MADRLFVMRKGLGHVVDDDARAYGQIEVPLDLRVGWYDPDVLTMTRAERAKVKPERNRDGR